MAIIYRVEGPHGYGPYGAAQGWSGWADLIHDHDDGAHPGIFQESRKMQEFWNVYERKAYYGFRSKAQLYRWFKGWIGVLLNSGFRITCYEAREYCSSQHQTLFVKKTSKRLVEKSKLAHKVVLSKTHRNPEL